MRAAVMYGAGDVRVEDRPDPKIVDPADAVVRTVAACVCGSDLWPYRSMPATGTGRPMGHEFLGVVGETGAEVRGLKTGDLVIAPFTYSDNTCDYCAEGLQSSCRNGGRYGWDGVDGGQGEAVRVPYADGTLVKVPVAADSALLLALSDVMPTGRHEARTDLGRRFGATDVVAARGEEGVARIRELTGGVDKVIEAVGTRQALKALIRP